MSSTSSQPDSTNKVLCTSSLTVRAPINIALVKYWGKSDPALNTPLNDSLSLTLTPVHPNSYELYSETTVTVIFKQPDSGLDPLTIKLVLNGNAYASIPDRVCKCVNYLVAKTNEMRGYTLVLDISIVSTNHFPTAVGLASSASGYAALAKSLGTILFANLDSHSEIGYKLYAESYAQYKEATISEAARLGSGSACRSLYGGIVVWKSPSSPEIPATTMMPTPIPTPTPSLPSPPSFQFLPSSAFSIFSHDYWPELQVLIVVLQSSPKSTSSTIGMQRFLTTCPFAKQRIALIPEKLEKLVLAIKGRDFNLLAEIIMQESNELHAVALASWPPVFYLTDLSRRIIEMVHQINTASAESIAAYTFDAGPNPFIIVKNADSASLVKATLERSIPQIEYIYQAKLGSGPYIVANHEPA